MGRWISGPTSILGGPGGVASPGIGTLVLTGLAPTILAVPQGQTVMPGVGSLLLTGKAPTAVVTHTGAFRTAIGSWGLASSRWGDDPTPDTVFSSSSGAALVTAFGQLDDARSAGACMFVRVTGGDNADMMNPDTSFSPTLWMAAFDLWVARVTAEPGGVAKLRLAVRDGIFRGVVTLDDFTTDGGENGYLHAVTYAQAEQICAHAKGIWPWMPLVARGVNSYLKQTAQAAGPGPRIAGIRQYQYLDAGWGQSRPRLDGSVGTWLAAELHAGEQCGLGMVGGINGSNQGSGTTPGWGCQVGAASDKCGVSPTELRTVGFAMLGDPRVAGFHWWSYSAGTSYWLKPAIQAAMQDLLDFSVGRTDGLLNIRNDGSLAPA